MSFMSSCLILIASVLIADAWGYQLINSEGEITYIEEERLLRFEANSKCCEEGSEGLLAGCGVIGGACKCVDGTQSLLHNCLYPEDNNFFPASSICCVETGTRDKCKTSEDASCLCPAEVILSSPQCVLGTFVTHASCCDSLGEASQYCEPYAEGKCVCQDLPQVQHCRSSAIPAGYSIARDKCCDVTNSTFGVHGLLGHCRKHTDLHPPMCICNSTNERAREECTNPSRTRRQAGQLPSTYEGAAKICCINKMIAPDCKASDDGRYCLCPPEVVKSTPQCAPDTFQANKICCDSDGGLAKYCKLSAGECQCQDVAMTQHCRPSDIPTGSFLARDECCDVMNSPFKMDRLLGRCRKINSGTVDPPKCSCNSEIRSVEINCAWVPPTYVGAAALCCTDRTISTQCRPSNDASFCLCPEKVVEANPQCSPSMFKAKEDCCNVTFTSADGTNTSMYCKILNDTGECNCPNVQEVQTCRPAEIPTGYFTARAECCDPSESTFRLMSLIGRCRNLPTFEPPQCVCSATIERVRNVCSIP